MFLSEDSFEPTLPDRKSSQEKDEDDDDDDEDDAKKEEDVEGDDENTAADEVTTSASGTLSALSDFQHSFESELRQPARNLVVKDLMIVFDPSSIYGNRSAFLKGMMVTVAWLVVLLRFFFAVLPAHVLKSALSALLSTT